jgi:hypothetical protein
MSGQMGGQKAPGFLSGAAGPGFSAKSSLYGGSTVTAKPASGGFVYGAASGGG